MAAFLTTGLALLAQIITFVTDNPLLLTSVVIGIAGYGISVVKNAIR